MTHDLIKSLLNAFEATLEKVLIYDMVNDVFYSELHILKDGKVMIIDARTSDAVALAVRADCPVFIKSEILDIVGTEIDTVAVQELSKSNLSREPDDLSDTDMDLLSLESLEEMLEEAISKEKYELAVAIRDAIKRKTNLNKI